MGLAEVERIRKEMDLVRFGRRKVSRSNNGVYRSDEVRLVDVQMKMVLLYAWSWFLYLWFDDESSFVTFEPVPIFYVFALLSCKCDSVSLYGRFQ